MTKDKKILTPLAVKPLTPAQVQSQPASVTFQANQSMVDRVKELATALGYVRHDRVNGVEIPNATQAYVLLLEYGVAHLPEVTQWLANGRKDTK
jgi:hypothetical protein